MTEIDDGGLLHKRGDRNTRGKPKTGAAIWRLYRNDTVWRGAVDLILIGSLIMLLVVGFPDLFSGLDRVFGSAAPAGSASSSAAGLSSSGPAANFAGTQQAATAAGAPPVKPLALPMPASARKDMPSWTKDVSAEDRELLERAHGLIGVANDQARALLETRAEQGAPDFQYLLGGVMVNDAFFEKSDSGMAKAIYWYKEAAMQMQPDAQFQLAQIFRLGGPGIPVDYAEAVKWYERAISNPASKNGEAERELGRMYEQGTSGGRDAKKAAALYEAAAKKGDAIGASNLAALYFNHDLGARDTAKALHWTRIAADQGYDKAQFNLARLYLRGVADGKPNYVEFLKWAGLAADQGDVGALLELGNFHREGAPGFPADMHLAARYFRLAAIKKDPRGQYSLARMYEAGLGMPQDSIQAFVYYSLAYRDGGFAPAYAAMMNIKEQMSPAQQEYAEKMARALQPIVANGGLRVTAANFSGIGVAIGHTPKGVYVTQVYPGTPAAQAGVKKEFQILSIDGVSVDGLSQSEVSARIRGKEGSTVTLTGRQPGSAATEDIAVKRAVIPAGTGAVPPTP